MGQWHRSINSSALMGAMLLALILPACQNEQAGKPEPAAPAGQTEQKAAEPAVDSGKIVVATTKNGAITIGDIRLYHRAVGIQKFGAMPAAMIDEKTSGVREAAEWIASTEAAAAALRQDSGTTFSQLANNYVDSRIKDIISKYITDTEVTNKLDKVAPEQIAAYYEEHKSEYRLPFAFRMRHLIMTTYEPYTVAQGDTLESIAERISGTTTSLIRADVPGRPLRREEGKEFKPLVEGEKLLVPMDDAKAEAVRQKLVKALEELKSGKTFEQLAKDKSEGGNGGEVSEWMPTGTTEPQILPEILDAAKKTAIGAVSEPFRTRHGWQAIEIVEKREESHQPVETVKYQIVQQIQEGQRRRLTERMNNMLLSQPGVVLHLDRITSDSEPAPDTVIAESSPTLLRFDKISTSWYRQGSPSTPEAIKRLIEADGEFSQALIDKWAAAKMSDPNSELNQLLARYRTASLGDIWKKQIAGKEAQAGVTEDELKKYYEENKEQYRVPDSLKLMILERRMSMEERRLTGVAREDALKRQLQYAIEDLETAKGPADFRTAASSIRVLIDGNEPPMSGQIIEVTMESLPSNIRERLKDVEPGKWTKPFIFDDKSAIALLVEERIPAGIRPFDKVRDAVQNTVMTMRFQQLTDKTEQDFLKKSGFQYQLAG